MLRAKSTKHQAEGHERKFVERRDQVAYKHAMGYEHHMERRPKKRLATLDGDGEPTFSPPKKN